MLTPHIGHKEFCKIPATVFEDAARTFIQHTHHILLHNAVLDLGLFQLKQIGMSSELARQVWRKQTTRMGFVVNITFDIPDTSEHFLVEPPWFHARVGSFGGKCHLAAVQAETGRDVIGATTTRISNFTASNPECEGYCIVFRVPLGHGSSEHSVATICEYFDWAQLWSMKVKPASEVVAIVKRDLDEVIDRRRARALKEAGR